VLAYLAVYGTWLVFRWGPHGEEAQIGDAAFVPITLVAVASAHRAAGRCRADRRVWQAWSLIGLALVFYLLGDVAQLIYESIGTEPSPSLSDPLYLMFYPLFFAGLIHVLLRVEVRSAHRLSRSHRPPRLLCLPSIYSTADAERERYSPRWVKLDSQWVAR
jgi:hypothetical protein